MISKSHGNAEEGPVAGEIIQDGILHFDATARRRNRMRTKANAEPMETEPASRAVASVAATSVLKSVDLALSAQDPWKSDQWKSRVQQAQHVASVAVAPKPSQVVTAAVSVSTHAPAIISTDASDSPNSHSNSNVIKSGANEQEYRAFLVGFVVEQTGYPEDIVELDSDLEADLGIDSIKVAQMMGELQERFDLDLTKIQVKSLDELRTLRQIIQVLPTSDHVKVKSIEAPSIPAVPQSIVESQPSPHVARRVDSEGHIESSLKKEMTRFLVEFVVEQTGYPEDIVELDADLEADLGIDSIKVAQMMGELNEHFALNVSSLRNKSSDDFKTLRMIVDTVLAAGITSVTSTNPLIEVESPTQTAVSKSEMPKQQLMEAQSLQSDGISPSNNGTSSNRSPAALQKFLVGFVVEQTGYPEDIVELDSDLEADLGIDSIKIAQMLGELKEHFNLDVSDFGVKSMDEFKTLRAIINRIAQ